MTRQAPKEVKLCEQRGETSIFIDAEITQDGDLLLSGQDIGRAPLEFWGDSDYEYWLTVPRQHKDHVLLALLEKLYRGNPSAVSQFRELLEAQGIPFQWHSYI